MQLLVAAAAAAAHGGGVAAAAGQHTLQRDHAQWRGVEGRPPSC